MAENTAKILIGHGMPSNTVALVKDTVGRKIPRPPNSWILYRSEMSLAMAAADPDSSRSQADVSKIISQMWKEIDPVLKADYERRAEMRKLEHAILYPKYRYNPKSKAEKEREREEKRQMKVEGRLEKRSKRPTPTTPSPHNTRLGDLPFPLTAANSTPSQYGPAGPSPPLSAANSPSPVTLWDEYQTSKNTSASFSATNGTRNIIDPSLMTPNATHPPNKPSHYRANPEVSQQQLQTQPRLQNQLQSQDQRVRSQTASYHRQLSGRFRRKHLPYMVARQHHLEQAQQPYQLPRPQQDQYQPETLGQERPDIHQIVYEAAKAEELLDPIASTSGVKDDIFSFNLLPMAGQNMEAWTLQNPEFQPSFNDFLTNTGNENYFQMDINPADKPNLGDEPIGALEVEMGEILPWSNILSHDAYDMPSSLSTLHQWDFSAHQNLAGLGDVQAYSSLFAEPTLMGPSAQPPEATSGPLAGPDTFAAELTSPEAFEQFLNFDPAFDYNTANAGVELPSSEIPQPTPYKPPSGAAHSSLRRVAASWNASFAIDV